MTPLLAIVICTHNGAARLPDVLRRLRAQHGVESAAWELVVVDNASTDGSATVARRELTGWDVPSQVVTEHRRGLVFARDAGCRATAATWVAFVDDDNHPAPDWVATACACTAHRPRLGAFGGTVLPRWETPPPAGIERLHHILGCTPPAAAPLRYEPAAGVLPPGSGLVVRRHAWLDLVPAPHELFFRGRFPGSRLGGEELECLRHLALGGWEIWHFPQLHIEHVMPAARTQPGELLALCRAGGLVRHHLRRLRWPGARGAVALPACTLADFARWALHVVRVRTDTTTRLVERGERAYLWGTLISPFYLAYWRRAVRDRTAATGPTPHATADTTR